MADRAPRLSNAGHKAIRHLPVVVAHLVNIGSRGVRIGGTDKYELIVQNDPSTKRPRVYIKPKNIEGIIDDAENSTLLKIQSTLRGAK